MPENIKNKFKDQYGEEGEKIYYATANKQGRDPETFKKKADESTMKKFKNLVKECIREVLQEENKGYRVGDKKFLSSKHGSVRQAYNAAIKYAGKDKKIMAISDEGEEQVNEYSVGGYSNTGGYSADMGNCMLEEEEYVPAYKSVDHSTFNGLNYHLKECGINTKTEYVQDGGQRILIRRDNLPEAIDILKNTADELGTRVADALNEKYFKKK